MPEDIKPNPGQSYVRVMAEMIESGQWTDARPMYSYQVSEVANPAWAAHVVDKVNQLSNRADMRNIYLVLTMTLEIPVTDPDEALALTKLTWGPIYAQPDEPEPPAQQAVLIHLNVDFDVPPEGSGTDVRERAEEWVATRGLTPYVTLVDPQ